MKKTLTIALAFVLVIALSVAGTFAYMTSSDSVTNTFIVGNLIDGKFELVEHDVVENSDGSLRFENGKEVKSVNYTIYPGVYLPKDPFVRVTTGNAETYLFLEVKDTLPKNAEGVVGVSWSIEDCWKPLMNGENQVESKAGNPIYVYTVGGNDRVAANTTLNHKNASIIQDNIITVPTDFNAKISDKANLNFNAYLFQADGFGTALASWNACYAEITK